MFEGKDQDSETATPFKAVEISTTFTVLTTQTLGPSVTPSPTLTKTPQPTDIPTPIPIDPSRYENWWVYTNTILGFSFRLPPDWVVIETTTGDPVMNGHRLNIRPQNTDENLDIRVTFRRIGEDVFLWPTGVGSEKFVSHGLLEVAGEPARRMLLICPTGQINSIWYQGETDPNIKRGNLEFGFTFSFSDVYCQEGYSLDGKVQHVGELIISSLHVSSNGTPTLFAPTSISPIGTDTSLPALSGSGGGVIAFQSDRDRQDEIYIMNADGSDQRLLISNLSALDSMPSWSPDGSRIAFASRERSKDFEICIASITETFQAAGETSCLTDNDIDDLHPTWSPDGNRIAFFSECDNHTEIYVIDVDSTEEMQLTEDDFDDKDPAWSPDGSEIAYISNREGDTKIYVMKPDGSDQRPLTDNDFMAWSPAWSPDGTQIAFISDRNGEHHLFVVTADGSNLRQLTDSNLPWNDDPTWSPDGTQIAFRSNNGGYVDIYTVSVDGSSTPRQLTHNAEIDQDRAPSWWPVSPKLQEDAWQ